MSTSAFYLLLLFLLTPCARTAAAADAADPASFSLLGFISHSAGAQEALERGFDTELDPAELRAWLKRLSSKPNHVGSLHDKANAEFMLQQFKAWGWDTAIETFQVLYPMPKAEMLELIVPIKFVASLREPPVAGDETSTRIDGLRPYNAYGRDGDVTAELVYVNFGMDEDYKNLSRRGINVNGKIVITRYGGGWRGLKPKLAQEHGAAGCLIYSDPRDDGYSAGDVYPKGGWRPADGVQRGSVLDLTIYPGDPLTPGVGATKEAKRLPISQAGTILKIPVLPISYADAQPLLSALGGPVAPASWRGSLPLTYHLGPGPAKVRLAIVSDWSLKEIYDVIARIPGSKDPDEWVIRGNHRDAWVFGAWDPLSGTVAMMAEAKAIGALLKTGWKPGRTLVYASWDAEEPGLLGSTEWAETHAEELGRKAVLYLNSDSNSRGFLRSAGSHSLQRFVSEVAASVPDPQTHVTVEARLRARMMVNGYEMGATDQQKQLAKLAADDGDLPLGALGAGSDYTPFLQHLGLGTLSIYYGGEDDQDGVSHSLYDSFDHYVRFGDPGFAYGIAEAQTVGRIVLRMANADVLPLQFGAFADAVDGYLQEVHKLADDKRKSAADLVKLLDRNAFSLAADPTRVVLPPEREPEVPYLDFASLDNAVARLKKSARAYDEAYMRLAGGNVTLNDAQRTVLNALLQGMEQSLTTGRGLPGRSWYRHLIYAPGVLTGYDVKTLPGVREAIEQHRWSEANEYVVITAAVLGAYCDRLDRATATIRS
jgi:N-acetylated-alpha-linked acidic dipeptidase